MVIALLPLGGCTVANIGKMGPQSHFDFPNSNVVELGPVKATVSGPGGLKMPLPTSAVEEALFAEAKRQYPGSDLIVDYAYTMRIKTFPLFPIYWSTLEIEGTAARMVEIGRQDLR